MKSPVYVRLAAVGFSPWVPIDYMQAAFAVALAGIPNSAFAGTWGFQHTFDELGAEMNGHPVSWTRATTTMTVTDLGPFNNAGVQVGYHGLSAGDNVILRHSPGGLLDSPKAVTGGDFGYQVASVTSPTVYTLTVPNVGPSADAASLTEILPLRVFNHAYLNATANATGVRLDGNYAFPPKAIRLVANTLTGGVIEGLIVQGIGRG